MMVKASSGHAVPGPECAPLPQPLLTSRIPGLSLAPAGASSCVGPGRPEHHHPKPPLAIQILAAQVPPLTGPPLAEWVQLTRTLPPSCCTSPCGNAGGGLCPSWPVWACVLQASFRNRCWWKEHTQRWDWHSRSRDIPRGLGDLMGRQVLAVLHYVGNNTDRGGTREFFFYLFIFSFYLFLFLFLFLSFSFLLFFILSYF